MASSIIDPGLRFAANQMLTLLRKDVSKVSQFTTNFTADAATKGTSMLIPIAVDDEAKEFAASGSNKNDYGDIDGSFIFTPMTFAYHPKHSFGFTPSDQTNIGLETINAMQKAGELSARAIGRKIATVVGGLINSTNIPTSGKDQTEWYDGDGNILKNGRDGTILKFSPANEYAIKKADLTKMTVAKFRKACNDADISASQTILALTPEKYAELLSLLDAEMYGGTEAIRSGFIPGLYGYKGVMEMNELNEDDLVGALIPDTAIAVASRLPGVLNPHLYQNLGTATDDASGMVFQFRQGGDWRTDTTVASVDCVMGAKLVQPTKIVRIVEKDNVSGEE